MGSPVLTLTGAGLQALGFGAVAIDLSRVQKRQFGMPRAVQHVQSTLRRAVGIAPQALGFEASAASTIRPSARLSIRHRVSPGAPLEARLAAAERNLELLERGIDDDRVELAARLAAMRKQQEEAWLDLVRDGNRQREEDREFLRGSVKLQALGTALFLAGTGVSAWGALA